MLNRPALIYLAGALLATSAVLGVTLWLYIDASRPAYETFTAAVVNAAATLAASTFVGVFDMFFTLQQMRRNQEDNRRWEELVERMRKDSAAALEQNRVVLEQNQTELAEHRAERERYQRQHEERYQAQEQRHQAELAEYRAEREENRQQNAELRAQNQQIMEWLLTMLERRNGTTDAASD